MKPNAKQAREAKLFSELCKKHGYMIKDAKRATVMMFDSKSGVMSTMRIVELAVPMDSALALAMPAKLPRKAKPKTESKP